VLVGGEASTGLIVKVTMAFNFLPAGRRCPLGLFSCPGLGRSTTGLAALGARVAVRFVARGGRKSVLNGQAHIVSLAFMVQRPGQSVTYEMPLSVTPPPPTASPQVTRLKSSGLRPMAQRMPS